MSRIRMLIAVVGIATAFASVAQAQESASRVKDEAHLFSRAAIDRVNTELGTLAKEQGVNVVIETTLTLGGIPVDVAASRRFDKTPGTDAYLFISKTDHRVSRVLFSPKFGAQVGPDEGVKARDQVLAEFKREHFDDGLEAFSRRMSQVIKVSDARPVADKESASALVERNRIRLTLAGAKKVQEAAEAKAAEMKVKVNIAIVDDGGHLLSFARMDGARPASATTAMTKAVSAATFRQPSGPLGEPNAAPDVHLNLSIQNAATASGGKITTLPGGIPIIVDDQVIGAIGVGGGTGAQDSEVARAGIRALTDEVRPTLKIDR